MGGEAPSVVVRVPGPEDVMDMLEFAEVNRCQAGRSAAKFSGLRRGGRSGTWRLTKCSPEEGEVGLLGREWRIWPVVAS